MIQAEIKGSIDKMLEKTYEDSIKEAKELYSFYKKHTAWLHKSDNHVALGSIMFFGYAVSWAIGFIIESYMELESLPIYILIILSGCLIAFVLGSILLSREQRKLRKLYKQHLEVLKGITWKEYQRPEFQIYDDGGYRKDALKTLDKIKTLMQCKEILSIAKIKKHRVRVDYVMEDNIIHHMKFKNFRWTELVTNESSKVILAIDDIGNYTINFVRAYY